MDPLVAFENTQRSITLGFDVVSDSVVQAEKNLKLFGKNSIDDRKDSNVIFEYLYHFREPITLVLIFAAAISAFRERERASRA